MPDVKAADVAELRKVTGAGMMDCKKALVESNGDLEGAKEWLRKKGLAGASKRAGRVADQGAIDVVVAGGTGAIAELTAETDFVAKSENFSATVSELAQLAVDLGTEDLLESPFQGSTVSEFVVQLASTLGENVALGRIVLFETSDGIVDGYRHVQNGRGTIGVLVDLGGVDPTDLKARDVAHDIALHVASAAPRYLSRDDVPEDVVAKERAVLEELSRNEGKPEAAMAKIIEGRMNGFFKDSCLLEQAFVREPKTTITQLLQGLGANATVRRFARIKIGEE
ncbi:MAG: translation elongation factor Ts [Actinobacteria bacterium]|nr:translation elongation factor Ts [Acidimicrobiia bacterium]PHX59662.1 MAG: translation elongation factor Ts [Actinomycetota bacterium]